MAYDEEAIIPNESNELNDVYKAFEYQEVKPNQKQKNYV